MKSKFLSISCYSLSVDPASAVMLNGQTEVLHSLEELALPEVVWREVEVPGGDGIVATARLTLPPGWVAGDNSLLFPVVFRLRAPGETACGAWRDEGGAWREDGGAWRLGWREYLSSGHQVAHVDVWLRGGDPSHRHSLKELAEFHLLAIE